MSKLIISVAVLLVLGLGVSACANQTTDVSQAPTDRAPAPANRGYRNISQTDMAQLMRQGVPLIDVRQPEEYKAGHVPGAKLVPLGTIAATAADWDKQKPLIVICQSGSRSASAANYLVRQGFTKVYNFPGGTMNFKGRLDQGVK